MFGVAGLLGAAVVVLPAIASSETPPRIEAYGGTISSPHYWLPASATIAPGGTVKFGNPYPSEPHGLKFTEGPSTPNCSGIPAAATEATGAVEWHGECTFSQPGTYSFVCTVHPSEMKGTVTVAANGTTITTTTTGTTTETQPGATPGVSTGAPGSGSPTTGASSLFSGSASSAVKFAGTQHGHSVHGSVAVSSAASGGTLEVQLLAGRASLASASHPPKVLVGRIVRTSLRPGRVAFAVTLNSKAKHALHVHGHLSLSVRILLTSAHGAKLTLIRSVVVRG